VGIAAQRKNKEEASHWNASSLFLEKIGGASGKKIEQALFFPLGLHYLSIK